MSKLNGVLIMPTGLSLKISGDAGANIQVKLIASCCKNLIINPNSVNASDINEMSDNCLYTEGSIIDRFLEGKLNLKPPRTFNKILMVVNPPAVPDNWNSMNASIHTLGADIQLLELKTPLIMKAHINEDGTAGGIFSGADELIEQIKNLDFDVLAIQTPIECEDDVVLKYWNSRDMVNPWGKIEAKLSAYLAERINKNLAHSPIKSDGDSCFEGYFHTVVVKQSMSPEIISNTFSHCMLKGLHKAPTIVSEGGLSNKDIDFLVSPFMCWGRPHEACVKNNIPIIIVKENTTVLKYITYPKYNKLIFVENYLESAGIIQAMNAGVDYRLAVLDKNKFNI